MHIRRMGSDYMHSIQTKFIIILMGCVLITTLSISIVGIYNTASALVDNSKYTMNIMANNTVKTLDNSILNIEKVVNMMEELIEEDYLYCPDQFFEEETLKNHVAKMDRAFKVLANNTIGTVTYFYRLNPEIETAEGFFYSRENADAAFQLHENTDLNKFSSLDRVHTAWYYEPKEAGKPVWINPYYTEVVSQDIMEYVVPIYIDGSFYGVCGMGVDISYFKDVFSSFDEYTSSYGYIVTTDEKAYFYPGIDNRVNIHDICESDSLIQAMINGTKDNEIVEYTVNNISKQLVSKKLSNGLSVVIVTSTSEVRRSAELYIYQYIIWLFVFAVLSFALSIFCARKFVGPIKNLAGSAKRIASGNLDEEIKIEGIDEISVLAVSFKQMVDSLKVSLNKLDRIARSDALTGVYSKAAYDQFVSQLDAMNEEERCYTIAVMDVNNLKLMNDTYGHEFGDKYLVDAASIIRGVFGKKNVYRIGGDEFVAIVTNIEDPCTVFQKGIDEFNASQLKNYNETLDIAIGIASYDDTIDHSFSDVFRRADESMYHDKARRKGN